LETQNRVKKAIAKAHDPIEQEKRQEEFLKYSKKVLSKVDSFIDSGLTIREAIRKTKDFWGSGNLTCQTIEHMFAERKRIQKGRKK
jgi:hypothetical protein